jgi:hypothetical protein
MRLAGLRGCRPRSIPIILSRAVAPSAALRDEAGDRRDRAAWSGGVCPPSPRDPIIVIDLRQYATNKEGRALIMLKAVRDRETGAADALEKKKEKG